MPKPVCVKCQCFYRAKKNSYFWTEMMPNGTHRGPDAERRGTKMPSAWDPYKIWSGDLYECPECQHQIVVGHGYEPVAVQHQSNFRDSVQMHDGDQLQVKDC